MRQLLLVFGVLVFALSLSGQGNSQGKGKGKASRESSNSGTTVSVVFSDSDRRAIRQWVQTVPTNGLPPGLAKRGELPPGLQKQLQRNGTLPPGLQKKVSPFPGELVGRLGPLPERCDCDRVFLDGKAMIIARATRAILDVISLF